MLLWNIIQVMDLMKSKKRMWFIISKKLRNNAKVVYSPLWMSGIAKNSSFKIIFFGQSIRSLQKIRKIILLCLTKPTHIHLKSENIFLKLTDNLYKNWLLESNLLNWANLIITKYPLNSERKHQNFWKKIRIIKHQFFQDNFKNH